MSGGGRTPLGETKILAPPPSSLWRRIHLLLAQEDRAVAPEDAPPFALTRQDGAGAVAAALTGELVMTALHISHLWVDPALRSQGVGTALLGEAETYARLKGCVRAHLETSAAPALAFYRKRGYRVFGELPDYHAERPLSFLEKAL